MRYLLIIFCALLSQPSDAGSLYLGGWSHHFVDDITNETHELVAIEYQNVIVGTAINSYARRAYFVGGDFSTVKYHLEWGVIAGLMTGYRDDEHPLIVGSISPMALVYVTPDWPVSPTLAIAPKFAMLTFKVRW
ncbi:hypothetical protein VST7929_01692 [Vibrio stylophorae]|uniref:Uncharacterized protein n=1 Tax=Vibrio stylophorae TaxID=659351 RepID=A0ABM8ZU17_9VIBR|nr:hypothetical protein [Vibrio stylophorae]CAH0533817.1 hypothetical protein VST7929_01692 [Vibrio stylophorae]